MRLRDMGSRRYLGGRSGKKRTRHDRPQGRGANADRQCTQADGLVARHVRARRDAPGPGSRARSGRADRGDEAPAAGEEAHCPDYWTLHSNMRLVSPYAPTSYRTPCLVVSTVWNSVTRETAVKFVTALNANHALAFGGDHAPPSTDWIVLKRHDSREAAEQDHPALARQFING